jgi:hypothetical protein
MYLPFPQKSYILQLFNTPGETLWQQNTVQGEDHGENLRKGEVAINDKDSCSSADANDGKRSSLGRAG